MWYTSKLINTPLWGQCRVRHRKAVTAKTNKSSNPYRRVVHPSIWHSCVWQRKLTNPPTIVWSFAVVRGWWSAIVLSFAVVRGWWPAIVLSHLPPKPNFTVQNERFARFYHLPWSGVGGLLLSYHLLWSGVGGQLLFYHMCHQNQISQSKTSVLRGFIICRGLGLVVCYCLIICCGQGLVICHQKQIS